MIGGAAISFASMIAVRVLGIANLAVLGRLLTPADFGTVALAMIVIGLMDGLLNNQFEIALLRRRASHRDEFNTAFTIANLVCGGAVLVILALAWPMAHFLQQPALFPVLAVLCVVPLLTGLRNPYFSEHKMALNLVPAAAANSLSRLAMTVVSVSWALASPSYWAIVAGTVSMSLCYVLLTYAWRPKRPRWGLKHGREYLGFGGWLTLAAALSFLQRRLPVLMIGRIGGAHPAGLFNVGAELSTTLTLQLITPLADAILPALSSVQDDSARMKRGYLAVQQILLGMLLPMGVGIALIAPEAVRMVLGVQWLEAVPIVQCLAPITALMALTVGVQSVVFIDGNTKGLCLRNLVVLTFVVVTALAGINLYGTMGAVAAAGAGMLLNLFLTLLLAQKAGMGHPAEVLSASRRSFLSVAAMAASVWAAGRLLGGPPDAAAPLTEVAASALAKIATGGVAYAGTHLALWCMEGRPQGFETVVTGLAVRISGRIRRRR